MAKEYIAGMEVVRSEQISGRHVVLLEVDFGKGVYLIGPNADGKYARVQAGEDGCFTGAYRKASEEGRFTEDLPAIEDECELGKVQI